MTDAAYPVTQSATEAFARVYLEDIGASIEENGDVWNVTLPPHVDIGFSENKEFEVAVGEKETEEREGPRITPESEFTQQLLEKAAEQGSVGRITLTEEMTEQGYEYPQWVTVSEAEVLDADFTPYYDRTAVCVFVKIGVETVSEYQTDFLQAVTLDIESRDTLPGITEILLEDYFVPQEPQVEAERDSGSERDVSSNVLAEVISRGQKVAVEKVREEITEVRESASRAADSEFEEYRQLQEQRIRNLREEESSVTDRLQELSKELDETNSSKRRTEALEKRQDLKKKKEEIEAQLEEILEEKEQGYSEKKREIDQRHAVDVSTKPVSLTLVGYERGEIKLEIAQGNHDSSVYVPYSIGEGVTGDVRCDNCGEELSVDNPIHLTQDSNRCQICTD